MQIEKLPPVKATLQPSNHPYLNGAWTPQHEEVTATDLEVIEGRIPDDIDGIYLRNTENQLHQPLGRYHPFDGDGMIHQIDFKGGKANYRNRFVRTRCFQAEQEAEGSLWGGLMDKASMSCALALAPMEALRIHPAPTSLSTAVKPCRHSTSAAKAMFLTPKPWRKRALRLGCHSTAFPPIRRSINVLGNYCSSIIQSMRPICIMGW